MDILQPLMGAYEELVQENVCILMSGENTRMQNFLSSLINSKKLVQF